MAEDIKYLWIDNKRCHDLWSPATQDTGVFPPQGPNWNVQTIRSISDQRQSTINLSEISEKLLNLGLNI